MPRIVNRLIVIKATGVVCGDGFVADNLDSPGMGPYGDPPPDGTAV